MKKILTTFFSAIFLLSSCVEMYLPPKNTWTDEELMSSQSGLQVYMARLYSQMPWEDFKYMAEWGIEYNGWLACLGVEGTGEAVTRDGICKSFTGERSAWWGKSYTLIREANHLIETLPEYRDKHSELIFNDYMGQAYFVRAYAYYQMARRFGGVPLVLQTVEYPSSEDKLNIPRSSEEETWDQILEDFTTAASLLKDESTAKGMVNKYVALAFKAEAMLYAGSVAKYNETVAGRLTGLGDRTKVRVIGFDESTWQSASNRYFSEAYKAASDVIRSGKFELRKAASNSAEDKYKNLIDLWKDENCSENMLIKFYSYPTLTHGLDAYSSPYLWHAPLSGGTCPTLDFMELFDGFERYSNGHVKVTDGTDCGNGKYLMFDNPMDFFKNAEPRLRAYVILPGDEFRNKEIEVRAGVYTGSASHGTPSINPFFKDYSYNVAGTDASLYQKLNIYTKEGGAQKSLYLSPSPSGQEIVEIDGKSINAAGSCGPFFAYGEATLTGLHLRKYLDPDATIDEIGEGKSEQPFILMRYADVLLAAAEAAVELSIAGVQCPVEGEDMLQIGTDAIKNIQERAGANVLDHKLSGTEEDRDLVRKERRKELAFEHKTKWDLRRWRVLHEEGRKGFWGVQKDPEDFGNGQQFSLRGIYPFYSTEAGQWFFDTQFQNFVNKKFSYSTVDYYFGIPSGEVSKSPVIDQQPNR